MLQTKGADVLAIDAGPEIDRIAGVIRDHTRCVLRRRGVVLGLSGGVDSSVAAALCVRALGPDRVLGLLMPERESSPDSLRLGQLVADSVGIRAVVEDITAILDAAGCYARRDAAIRSIVSDYGPGYRSKVVLPRTLDSDGCRLFSVVVESPAGERRQARLTADAYLNILGATNFKQRVRKMMEYHYADRLQYAVVGATNRLEHDQGFFVKNGDGAADLKPIAHLYKTQVYALAGPLGVPEDVRTRTPTTDTYSLTQSQEEFFFSVPYGQLDLCLYGVNHGMSVQEIVDRTGLAPEQVERVYRDIELKRRATAYLHKSPLLADLPAEDRSAAVVPARVQSVKQ
jgi:NAD+ synthase